MYVSKFLNPKNDVAFKRIFAEDRNKDILMHFINDIMGFTGNDEIKEVTFLSPIQNPEIASKKQSILDVLCKAADGTQIIIEMQVSPSKGFAKRAQYYAAKAYSRQLDRGQENTGLYHNLRAVIFIAISNYCIFPDKPEYISHHVIMDKESYENDLKDFSFTFIELPKFPITQIDDLKTMLEKWCYFFKYAESTQESELEQVIGGDEIIKRAYTEVNRFNWSPEQLLAYEQEIKRIMDNLASEHFLREEGKAEGEIRKAIQIAQNLLRAGLNSNLISESTGLSIEEIEKLRS